ncbi:carbonyl reductase [Canna indica]|uniref:Carbonyl reductase n=1 Tax=Canna indica TaxID=4628 RepID=A0AAQ3QRG4_9LILI|nr:carbonyl reductase [Canna indica]
MGKLERRRAKHQRLLRYLQIAELRKIPYSTLPPTARGPWVVRHPDRKGRRPRPGGRRLLRREGLNVEFRQLDILDADSIESFANWVGDKYGGLDILVNNADVNLNKGDDISVEFAEKVIATNYVGTKRMIKFSVLSLYR